MLHRHDERHLPAHRLAVDDAVPLAARRVHDARQLAQPGAAIVTVPQRRDLCQTDRDSHSHQSEYVNVSWPILAA